MEASERRARAAAEATGWWLKLQADDVSREEREAYVRWLRESALHVAEMLQVAQIHSTLEQFQGWERINTDDATKELDEGVVAFPLVSSRPPLAGRAGAAPDRNGSSCSDDEAHPEGNLRSPARHSARYPGRRQLLLAGLAASIVAAGIAVTYWAMSLGQTIVTDRGERREVALNDGSVLQVDPETKLRVKLGEHSRQIVLQRGRALFRVAKDPDRPFTVQADDTIVRAVGTAFAVDRREQAITVTVAEGKVAVSSASSAPSAANLPEQKSPASAASRAKPGSPSVLIANEQLTIKRSGPAEPIRTVDTARELAWSEGRLVFDNTSVAEAIADFNRYNLVQLRVTDASLGERPISGVFDASDPESFIAFIQSVAHARVERDNDVDITITAAH